MDATEEWRKYPCKVWTGAKAGYKRGYGVKSRNGRQQYVHRLAWEDANGPIPDGLFVLHHCDTPACYEEKHLFLGTHQQNMDDMVAKGRSATNGFEKKTHCKHGHEFTAENTIHQSNRRICRACRVRIDAESWARHGEKRRPQNIVKSREWRDRQREKKRRDVVEFGKESHGNG